MDVEVVVKSNDLLGEGPVWSNLESALYWVDIERKLLQRWDSISKEQRIWKVYSNIGSFALQRSGGAVVALREGFFMLNLDDERLQKIGDPECSKPYTRFNDGKCDRQGRFWAGTMDEQSPKKRAALYRLNLDRTIDKVFDHVGISNGMGWSPNNKVFYYTDSVEHTIYAFDFDLESGSITNKRVFAQTPDDYVPDGLTVDSEGFIWSANWDGWKILRYDPGGEIDMEIPLPVQRPTSCTFGGPELNHLFVTSARLGLDRDVLERQPLAGSVFRIKTQVHGIVEPFFEG
jgi:sugar lactone lactonase YvrE